MIVEPFVGDRSELHICVMCGSAFNIGVVRVAKAFDAGSWLCPACGGRMRKGGDDPETRELLDDLIARIQRARAPLWLRPFTWLLTAWARRALGRAG